MAEASAPSRGPSAPRSGKDDIAGTIRAAVAPVLAELGTDLYDVELSHAGRAQVVRILIDRPGGVDLEAITAATQAVNPVLDRLDLMEGRSTLEVSSPGLERPLRRPEHFAGATGTEVSVKTTAPVAGARRHRGVLTAADEAGIDLVVDGEPRRLAFSDISSAHTVFQWGAGAPTARRGR
jgi:ribosome maturation factor RimP